MLDTPLHMHSKEDEPSTSWRGTTSSRAAKKSFGSVPAKRSSCRVAFRTLERRVVTGEGRQLVICTPGGLEQFFRDLAEADQAGRLGADAYAEASKRAGITWL